MPAITRLVGVYDAVGTLRGEVAYWIGARLGRRHCALCDITHGLFSPKAEWRECRDSLHVRFDTVHLDDQPDQVRAALAGIAPAVVAETDDGGVAILLGPDELEACHGSVHDLLEAVERAAAKVGLMWSGESPSAAPSDDPHADLV
jgi:hypothetical protein